MDPPYPTHAFSRPQSQQPAPESRYGPIPPSPFASQPVAQRSDTLHKNDPFLRRRNDLDERRRSPSMTNAPQSYMLPQAARYTSCSTSVPHDGTTASTRPRQSSFGAGGLWGDGLGDRLALHRTEGTECFISLLGGWLEGHAILGTYCLCIPSFSTCFLVVPEHVLVAMLQRFQEAFIGHALFLPLCSFCPQIPGFAFSVLPQPHALWEN